MMYPIIPQPIPFARRAEINEKILYCIDTKKSDLTKDAIYNCYTGIGGLHGLKQEDFPNFHEYTKAKQEIEMGQFFTPHTICQQMIDLVSPEPDDMVLDMCCGIGNFFNHLPNEFNAFGFDIDVNSVKVAKHLYPNAQIDCCDIRRYDPDQRFDIVIGNPPFNLDFNGSLSQYYYCNKAFKVLNPAGLLVFIVPCSFMKSDFWNSTQIKGVNNDFSFIGQTKLDPNAFASTGVENFETKIMVFIRESSNIEMQEYEAETFLTMEELKLKVSEAKTVKQEIRIQLIRESNDEDTAEATVFEYKLKKYLYELKTHKAVQEYHTKALALVSKFRNQKPPENCTQTEFKNWEKNKLTHVKVLNKIRKYIRKQHPPTVRYELALVKNNSGFKLKSRDPKKLKGIERKSVSMIDLVAYNAGLPQYPFMTDELQSYYKAAEKIIRRKKKKFAIDNAKILEMPRDPELDKYIESLTFINPKDMSVARFNELQKHDMGLIFQKYYSMLNWQQGSGKTAVLWLYGKYLLERGLINHIFILAPANACEGTWTTFLKCNNEKFINLKKPKDFDNIPKGSTVMISITRLKILKRYVKRFVKKANKKIFLLFDESHEIVNHTSQNSKTTIECFRRLKYKMEGTGTAVLNHIGELYPELELLYNNSVNLLSESWQTYYQNKDKEIASQLNTHYKQPYPARGGAAHFKECHCPGKASVFGIEKFNQDIYNKDVLNELIRKTIITRKFSEFAGERCKIVSHHVTPSLGEKEVYRLILEEFASIYTKFFNSKGDARKEAALRLSRQIFLMIKACSVPHLMPGYFGFKYPQKLLYIGEQIRDINARVAVGCTSLQALAMYKRYLEEQFPDRPVFVIKGEVNFHKRGGIVDQFKATENGILLSTQQSLKSSINIHGCYDVFLEALQWNLPKMEQYYRRYVRLDSDEDTRIHFVTNEDSIEQNIMMLILTKERLNEFVSSGEIKEESAILSEFGYTQTLIDSLLRKEYDKDGKTYFTWGQQQAS